MQEIHETNLSHSKRFNHLSDAIDYFRKRISNAGHLPYVTIEEQEKLLTDFAKTPLGKHILLTGGANAYWTDYMIAFPQQQPHLAASMLLLSRMEYYLIFESLITCAQRELFLLSQKTAQSFVKENASLVSLPCGIMRDLLELDYSSVSNVHLLGIDLDPEALDRAKHLARAHGISSIEFMQQDAWSLNLKNRADFVTSIGLNCYENDRNRVIELYRTIHEMLKPGGVFFTGVMTYPSDWNPSITKEQILMEKILMSDILDLKWQNYRTLKEIEEDFLAAGFNSINIIPDSRSIFPAVIAQKNYATTPKRSAGAAP